MLSVYDTKYEEYRGGKNPFWVNFNIQLYSWQNIFYNKTLIYQRAPMLYYQVWYLVDQEMAAGSPCRCWGRGWSFQRWPRLQSHLTLGHALPKSGCYIQRLRQRCKGRAIGPGGTTPMGHVTVSLCGSYTSPCVPCCFLSFHRGGS